jgi:hypothetical protein
MRVNHPSSWGDSSKGRCESGESHRKCSRKQAESPGVLGVTLWITQYVDLSAGRVTHGKSNKAAESRLVLKQICSKHLFL